jgi:hypothetical protein
VLEEIERLRPVCIYDSCVIWYTMLPDPSSGDDSYLSQASDAKPCGGVAVGSQWGRAT